MSNVPLPRPGPLGLIQYAGIDMLQYAGEVSAAKDAEIAQLRADATDRQNNVVMPLRERVRELTTQAMFNTSTIERLRAEVAGLRKALAAAIRQNEHDMLMTGEELRAARAALAARKGEA